MNRIAEITVHKAPNQVPNTYILTKNANESVNKLIFYRLKALHDRIGKG